MRTPLDRIRQAVSFEAIGLLLVVPLMSVVFNHEIGALGVLAIIGSTLAMVGNYVFNLGFDHAMRRLRGTVEKTFVLRLLHAVLFEVTLLVLFLPVIAWWLGVSLWQALMMDLTFAAFYMVYTFVFTWAYERVFPVTGAKPEVARGS